MSTDGRLGQSTLLRPGEPGTMQVRLGDTLSLGHQSFGPEFGETENDPVIIRLRLGSFTLAPYLYPHICDQIEIDITDANVASFEVYLEGEDGSSVLLCDSNGTFTRPKGPTTEYMGSWDQDYGAGVITDQGADTQSPEGQSAAAMADPERSFAPQLLPGYTAKYLRFEIVPVNAANPIEIGWPTISCSLAASRVQQPENAHQSAIIHPSGPGVRFGQMVHAISGTIQTPPLLGSGTYRPTIIDGLCFGRLVLDGVSQTGGSPSLTTELTQRYDTYEGQSVGQVDGSSNAFLLPKGSGGDWRFALVNSMSEVPPLGCFPRGQRSTSDWTESATTYVQEAWSWAQEPDYLVSAQVTAHIEDGAATVITSPVSTVAGWKMVNHRHRLDNTETGYEVTSQGQVWAEIRPFRGHFCVLIEGNPGLAIDYEFGRDGKHYRAYVLASGFVRTEVSDNTLTWTGSEQSFDASALGLTVAKSARGAQAWLIYADAGTIYERSSPDGVTWSVSTSVGSGTQCKGFSCRDGRRFRYWLDGDEIFGDELDGDGNIIGSSGFSTGITGADDACFGVDESFYGQNRRRVVIQAVIAGTVTEFTSQDGRSFS